MFRLRPRPTTLVADGADGQAGPPAALDALRLLHPARSNPGLAPVRQPSRIGNEVPSAGISNKSFPSLVALARLLSPVLILS
jgi:hypothetical protein